VLRLLSFLFPQEIPYHPHWRAGLPHPIYWSLQPTLNHLVPLGRGGRDELDNQVTTSMMQNALKGQWTLEELGWKLQPAGSIADWDGLMGWFCEYVGESREGLSKAPIAAWYRAAVNART